MGKYSILWNESVRRTQNRYNKMVYLPVMLKKVMVPCEMSNGIGFFEQLVLELLEKGPKLRNEVADILQLDIEFVEKLYAQLIEKNYISNDVFTLTDSGRVELEDCRNIESKKEAAYIFYDLLGGFYWDILVPEEELRTAYRKIENIDFKNDKEVGNFKVDVGTEGAPEKIPVCYLPMKQKELNKVSNAQIKKDELINIIKKYKKLKRYAMRQGVSLGRYHDFFNPIVSLENSGELIGETVYLGTQIYIPENISQKNEWQVLNPFGFGDASHYKYKIEQNLTIRQRKKFNEWIEEMYRRCIDSVQKNLSFDVSDTYLEKVFTSEIEDYRRVKKFLDEILMDYYVAFVLDNKGLEYDNKQGYLRNCIRGIYSCLEQAVEESIQASGKSLDGQPTQRDAINRKIIGLAKTMKFDIDNQSRIFSFSLNNLNEGLQLLHLVGKTIMLQTDGICNLAKWNHDFLNFIQELSEKRNAASHYSNIEIDAEDVKGYFQVFLRSVASLLQIPYNEIDYFEHIEFVESDENMKYREELSNLYGIVSGQVQLKNYDGNIEDSLIKLKMYLTAKEKQLGEFKEKDATIAMGRIYEGLLSQIATEVIDTDKIDLVDDDMDENIAKFKREIRRYEFDLDEKAFEKKYRTVNVFKIRNCFENFERGVISWKLAVLLFSTMDKPKDKFVTEIAQGIPEFIDFGIRLDKARGHGDENIDSKEAKALAIETEVIVKKFYEIKEKFEKENSR